MALEELGGWKDTGTYHGPRFGHHLRGREETEEEAFARLPLCQFEEPQFLGLQILFLRTPLSCQRYRFVNVKKWFFFLLDEETV